MSTYLLDTGILVGYVRGAAYAEYVEESFGVTKPPNIALISVVSKGEVYSLAMQFGWDDPRKKQLEDLLNKIPFVDVSSDRIIRQYAEIDAFSQGKHPLQKLPNGLSSRNMGKNDIWIAATASVINATLLTTDHDFDHLDGIYVKVAFIDQKMKGNRASQ